MSEKKKKHANPSLFNTMMTPHFCPGCHYGIIIRCLAEALEKTEAVGDTILVTGIGCSMVSAHYIKNLEGMVALHGRAPAVATGIKRSLGRDKIVMTMTGDGDLSSIGIAEIVAAANRFEKITSIFLNNSNFGTTGGQMAPTSLIGQVTPTSPEGRTADHGGFPIHMAELMAQFKGVVYSFRGTVHTHKNYNRTLKAIVTAIEKQREDAGLSFVEILAACPPGHHVKPKDGLDLVTDKLIPEFELGEFKNADRPV